jgi:hypothetical protein
VWSAQRIPTSVYLDFLGRIGNYMKEKILVQVEVLSGHLPEGSEKYHENVQDNRCSGRDY